MATVIVSAGNSYDRHVWITFVPEDGRILVYVWQCLRMLLFTEMQVRVAHNYDRVLYLNVEPQDSVRKLKLMLTDVDGIHLPPFAQLLQLGDSSGPTVGAPHSTVSFPAEDERTLADYGVRDGSSLFLSSCCSCCFFDIYVESVAGRIADIMSLRVTLDDTVHSIKRLLQEKMGISVDRQHLSFEGDALDDDTKLNNCRFITRSTLDLAIS